MIVIVSFDWFGTDEALKELSEAWNKICKETAGIKSTKFYSSHQARYHFSWIVEADSYDAVWKVATNPKMPPRDRKVLAHWVTEIFTEVE